MSENRKNILLINHYAGSPIYGMEFRPYYLAREWVRQGHDVTIVASSESHVRYSAPKTEGAVAREVLEGIRYFWLKTSKYQSNGFKRVLNMFSFIRQLYKQRKQLETEKPFDIVIASSTYPLDIYPAQKIAKEHDAKLVFEVHDLWPLSPMELSGMSPWHPFIMMLQHAENYACKNCDKVISLLPNADRHLIKHGMNQRKFSCVPNGVVLEDWKPDVSLVPEEHRKLIDRLKSEGKTVVGYLGGHGPSNALEDLIQVAKILKNEPIAFVLVGKGSDKEKLIQECHNLELTNIHFLPPVPKTIVSGVYSLMDLLYSGWRNKPLYRYGVSPNKILDYMLSGKPIVHAVASPNDLVADAKCGISVPAEDCPAIAEAIQKLSSLTIAQQEEIGNRGAEFVKEHLQYSNLAKQFLDHINEENSNYQFSTKDDQKTKTVNKEADSESGSAEVEPVEKVAS